MTVPLSELIDPDAKAKLYAAAGLDPAAAPAAAGPEEAKDLGDVLVDAVTGDLELKDEGPGEMEHKAAPTGGGAQVLSVDDETGVVEALVSVTGVEDRVKDTIEPGAYTKTLAKHEPIGVWSHDDKTWVARTEEARELLPGDPFFKGMKTMDGQPWPIEAGAVYVKSRFNLETPHGKAAYSDVKFFQGKTGWSIGYRATKATRNPRTGQRSIKELDWFEYSPVMVGAASQPMTLSVKSLAQPVDHTDETGFVDEELLTTLTPEELKAYDELKASLGLEVKDRVRTPEGERRFGQPIGSVIVPDGLPQTGPVSDGDLAAMIKAAAGKGEDDEVEVLRAAAKMKPEERRDFLTGKGSGRPPVSPKEAMAGLNVSERSAVGKLSEEDTAAYAEARGAGKTHTEAMAAVKDGTRSGSLASRMRAHEAGVEADQQAAAAGSSAAADFPKDTEVTFAFRDKTFTGKVTGHTDTGTGAKVIVDSPQAGLIHLDPGKLTKKAEEKPKEKPKPVKDVLGDHVEKVTGERRADLVSAVNGIIDALKTDARGKHTDSTDELQSLLDDFEKSGSRADAEALAKRLEDLKEAPDGGRVDEVVADLRNQSAKAPARPADKPSAGKDDGLAKFSTSELAGQVAMLERMNPDEDSAAGQLLKQLNAALADRPDYKRPDNASTTGKRTAAGQGEAGDLKPSPQPKNAGPGPAAAVGRDGESQLTDAQIQQWLKNHRSALDAGVNIGQIDRDKAKRLEAILRNRDREREAAGAADARVNERAKLAALNKRRRARGQLPLLKLPDNMKALDLGESTDDELEVKVLEAELAGGVEYGDPDELETKGSRASLNRSPKVNWVERAGDLPGYVREIARAIERDHGYPLDRAIPIAIGRIKRWAAGEGDVTAETRAKAAAAVAQWEALKAKNAAKHDSDLLALIETKARAEVAELEAAWRLLDDAGLLPEVKAGNDPYVRDPQGRFDEGKRRNGQPSDTPDGDGGDGDASNDKLPRDPSKYDLDNPADVRNLARQWGKVPNAARAALKKAMTAVLKADDEDHPHLLAVVAGLGDGDGVKEEGEGAGAALRDHRSRRFVANHDGKAIDLDGLELKDLIGLGSEVKSQAAKLLE